MRLGTTEHVIVCPHCGHNTPVQLDSTGGDQEFYEDCRACCSPIHLKLHIDELQQKVQLFVDADDEQNY